MKFRIATFQDYHSIAKLHIDSWKNSYRGILSDDYLDNRVEAERMNYWHDRMKNPKVNQVILLCEETGSLLGFVGFYVDDDEVLGTYIDNLHVQKELKGQGIGKLILQEVVKWIKQNAQYQKMYLWVYEANHSARVFYQKVGAINNETLDLENPFDKDQKVATCRYIWSDFEVLSQ
jgi:GNAT superfamily N-acetyltransferase